MRGERYLNALQDFLPVGTDFLWMEAEHGEAVARILCTDVEDGVTRLQVDGWQEDACAASLTGPLDDSVAIVVEFLAIQVAMSVDELQIRNQKLGIRNDNYLLR